MSSATLTAESVVTLPREQVFGLFGHPEAGSWLFDARCERVAVGNAVRLTLPIDQRTGRRRVELLGWISRLRPPRGIVIDHVQPWQGRLRLSFDPAGINTTRVRVRADVSAAGAAWLVRHSGVVLPLPEVAPGVLRIGLVASKSGPAAVYSAAIEHLAELAVEEINADGGVEGRHLELVVADDCTDPSMAAQEARRLVRAGCRAVFACTTSSCFSAINNEVGHDDALVVHAAMNERGPGDGRSVIRLGERPDAQVGAVADRLMRATGAGAWFLVGERYSWSYAAHLAARGAVSRANGRILGESYTPVGTTDYGPVIEQIERSGADVVMSSLIGADEVEFERQSAAAGLRVHTNTLSLVLDESTVEHIGATAAEGLWTAMGYFQDGPVAGNADLVARYRARYGRWAPPISTLSETVYEAIVQYAQSVRHRTEDSAAQQGRALIDHRGGAGGTAVGARDLTDPRLFLAEVRSGELRVIDEARGDHDMTS